MFLRIFMNQSSGDTIKNQILDQKESLIILIIICIVGVLYLIQKYTNFPALNKTIDFISAILEKLCTFISNL